MSFTYDESVNSKILRMGILTSPGVTPPMPAQAGLLAFQASLLAGSSAKVFLELSLNPAIGWIPAASWDLTTAEASAGLTFQVGEQNFRYARIRVATMAGTKPRVEAYAVIAESVNAN